jgi:hypothetical protein
VTEEDKGKLRYECVIQGHEPPYIWKVIKPKSIANKNVSEISKMGSAETYREALEEAGAAAQQWEQERIHKATVRHEVVLEVDIDVPIDDEPAEMKITDDDLKELLGESDD